MCFGGSPPLINPVPLAPGVFEFVSSDPNVVTCNHETLLGEEGQGLTVFGSFSKRMRMDVFCLNVFNTNV